MMFASAAAGWLRRRPAVAVLLLVVGVGLTSGRARSDRKQRGPIAQAVAGAAAPRVDTVFGVLRITSPAALERLLPDTSVPRERVRLLWLAGRAAQPTAGGTVVVDDASGVLEVGEKLRVRRRRLTLDGRAIASVAAAAGNGLWVTTAGGEVLRVDSSGTLVADASQHSLGYTSVGGDARGSRPWLVRSTSRFAFQLDSGAPLLVRLDANGRGLDIGRPIVPAHALLTDLANAGSIAVSGDTAYYAPFIRDEVVALGGRGDTLWIASRGLPQSTSDPRFEVVRGRATINYHPVNLGVALGPDGALYALSTPGFTTAESRLDVFDRQSGRLLRSARLSTALPTIAVAADGRVYLLDALRLLTGVAPSEREALPPIALPLLAGGHMTLDAAAGRLTLVNVWASWCAPCRSEMPALDSLKQQLAEESRFLFVTMNEDVRPADARAFLAAYGFDFPVMLGGGRLQSRLHYPGLPYTILLDASGRIVQRWIGFTGPDQIDAIRTAIAAELTRMNAVQGPTPSHSSHGSH
ncbi:MAG: redoxin family protein [Gemmatimonadaceae bacterium]